MDSLAFVPSFTPLVSSFTPSKSTLLSSRTAATKSRFFFQTQRCRVSHNVPIARLELRQVDKGPDMEGFNLESFSSIMEHFSLAAMGVYIAMSDISLAAAVPEELVEAFKSKPASLAHPTVMWCLFGTCLYTFYLGYQTSLLRKSEPEERKKLAKGRFGERHFKLSSSLFAVMTVATLTGMANTYTRTDKLFPGPHLYAGLGLVALLSIMSSFAPYMLRGKEWARNAHFTLAFVAVGLFGWQAKSGMAIVGKLLGWD